MNEDFLGFATPTRGRHFPRCRRTTEWSYLSWLLSSISKTTLRTVRRSGGCLQRSGALDNPSILGSPGVWHPQPQFAFRPSFVSLAQVVRSTICAAAAWNDDYILAGRFHAPP